MEKSQQVVHVLGGQKIWNLHCEVEPSRNTDLCISTWDTSIWRNVFLDLHMDLVCMRVEVKHHRLLGKPVLVMNLGSNLIQVLVNRLLYVKNRRFYPVDMVLDPLKSPQSLFDLPVRPHRLDTISRSFLNNDVNRQLLSALPPLVSFESIFDGCYGCNSLEQSVKEQDHLLILMDVNSSVIVKNIEANGNHNV